MDPTHKLSLLWHHVRRCETTTTFGGVLAWPNCLIRIHKYLLSILIWIKSVCYDYVEGWRLNDIVRLPYFFVVKRGSYKYVHYPCTVVLYSFIIIRYSFLLKVRLHICKSGAPVGPTIGHITLRLSDASERMLIWITSEFYINWLYANTYGHSTARWVHILH